MDDGVPTTRRTYSEGREHLSSPFHLSHRRWLLQNADPPLPLSLSFARRPGPAAWDTYEAGSQVRNAVLHRDGHCCRFCGLCSRKYQNVLAKGGHTRDVSSLATVCILCAQVLTLDRVPPMKSGVLIEAPDITQADLNAMSQVIYICRISQGPAAEAARELLDMMLQARVGAKTMLGSDNPQHLVDAMLACRTARDEAALRDRLQPIRLLPLDRRIIKEADLEFNQFPQILAYWRSKDGPFGGISPLKMNLRIFDELLTDGLRSPVRWRFPVEESA